jgi:oxygen-independent coproporphyrinogen III oxidase
VFGLYAHIPFCVHRCSYCDFYSSTEGTAGAFGRIADKIIWEAGASAEWLASREVRRPLTSVFFGGGTPSLMPLPDLARVFESIQNAFPLENNVEVTLEANPETVDATFAQGLLARTPVNRVSLGAQSFQSKHLATLERRGSAESIRTAVQHLRNAGLSNFSLDLIFGIPGQSVEDLFADIDSLAELDPKHLSFYSLTLKPGHRLFSGLPSDDEAAELYEKGVERLRQYGYFPYEISNFSKPGFRCQHNLLYWSGGDFLGLGPSAASRFFWDGVFHHRKQVSHWEKYLDVTAFPSPVFESTTREQTVLEGCFLELRKSEGIDLEYFEKRYGYHLRDSDRFQAFLNEGLLVLESNRIFLSPKGWLLAEGVAERLVRAQL